MNKLPNLHCNDFFNILVIPVGISADLQELHKFWNGNPFANWWYLSFHVWWNMSFLQTAIVEFVYTQ
jgi:hypothetical protein